MREKINLGKERTTTKTVSNESRRLSALLSQNRTLSFDGVENSQRSLELCGIVFVHA